MKRWSWLLVIAFSVSTLAIVGCGGNDNEDSTPTAVVGTTTTNAASGVTTPNTVGGVTTPNTTTGTHPPILTPTPTPSITSLVLLDISQGVNGGSSFEVNTEPTPQAGSVSITASWTAIDLMAGGAPMDIPLEFRVNQGVSGAGSFVNSGHPSPFTGSVSMPASLKCKIQVYNNIPDSTAIVHLRAVWNAD